MTATQAAGQKFFDNADLLRRVARFQQEVAEDPSVYRAGILARFESETLAYGRQQLHDMYRALIVRDFPDGSLPAEIGGLLEASRDRYVDLWQRNIENGFAAAASSVPRATRLGTRTLLQRLADFFRERDPRQTEVPEKTEKTVELHGIVRTALVNGRRRVYRMRLAPYLKMLFRTYPMNFLRDHELIVARWKGRGGPGEDVFFINAGRQHNSSPVCVLCQGRALTRSALVMVTRELQSPLFHPNCRHRILSKAVQTEGTYDGSAGPLVTTKVVQQWISQGKVKRSRRPNPVVVNV